MTKLASLVVETDLRRFNFRYYFLLLVISAYIERSSIRIKLLYKLQNIWNFVSFRIILSYSHHVRSIYPCKMQNIEIEILQRSKEKPQ